MEPMKIVGARSILVAAAPQIDGVAADLLLGGELRKSCLNLRLGCGG